MWTLGVVGLRLTAACKWPPINENHDSKKQR